MADDYVLTCSSVADLPAEFTEERHIDVMPFHLYLDGKEYLDDQGKSISNKEFFDQMRSGASPSTSMVSFERYMNFFRPYLEQGKDVLHLELSANLSGAHDNALRAARDLMKEFPDRKVVVVDTRSATGGLGLLVDLTEREKENGATLEEAAKFANDLKQRIQHWFVVGDLEYLRRGGRLSRASAMVGSMLNIKPVLAVDTAGRVTPVEKIRGRKKSIQSLLQHVKDQIDNNGEGQTIVVVHADDIEEAEPFAEQLREALPAAKEVIVREFGPVIGAHLGPGAVGVTFIGDGRPEGTED